MKRAAGLTGCREVNLLAQTSVVSLQAGAILQFRHEVLLHVPVWQCPHLEMRGKCLHSGGAMGTQREPYTT